MDNKEQKNVVDANDDLQSYMGAVIAVLKREKKYAAAHNYLSVLHSFMRFDASMPQRRMLMLSVNAVIPMQEIFTSGRLKEYERWLNAQAYSPNTVSTYMHTLQAVYNRWMPPGMPGHNSVLFDDVYTKVESRTKRALSASQMKKLMNMDFKMLPVSQQQVLAYFLLMFMLRGMPFIDLAHLRKSSLQNGRLVYLRHKTGKLMIVDIPPEAYLLLKKFRDKTNYDFLFPILNGPLLEKGGLDDDELMYSCYQDALRRYNRMLAKLMRQLLPGIPVSSYTARHTWATLAYHEGIPVGIISQALGHSSIRVTMTYLKPFEAEVMDKVNRQIIALVRKGKKKKCDRRKALYNMML